LDRIFELVILHEQHAVKRGTCVPTE
jgi:hypothetical protein